MAQTKKAKAGPKKKKSSANLPAKAKQRKRAGKGVDGLAKLIDHPLVTELLAVGAMAAVGAIADYNVQSRTGEVEKGSRKALKSAGKAAATAIGKRLKTEFDEIQKAGKKAKR